MKEINLKTAMTAYRRYAEAKEHEDYCRKYQSYTDTLPDAKARTADAKADLDATLTKLEAALGEIQKRCTARTVSGLDVVEELAKLEDRLGITKKAMEGCEAWLDPNAQNFPNAYKYVPGSTQLHVYYKNGSWRVDSIERYHCRADGHSVSITLTDEAKEAVLRKVCEY